MLAGLGGHLLSGSFLERTLASHGRVPPDVHRAFERWRGGVQHGPATSLRTMLEASALPLFEILGFRCVDDVAVKADRSFASLRTGGAPVLLLVARYGERLDPLWRPAVSEALARGASWCVLFNGTHLRLVSAARLYSRRFVEFDLDAVADDARTSDALWMLLQPAALGPASTTPSLESLVADSDRETAQVSVALRHGVLDASRDVLQALITQASAGSLDDAFEQALTVVYRIVFLFFAEARSLVPLWHPVYRSSYSLEALRTQALSGSATGLWDALRAIARLAHAGCAAGNLRVTAFNGRLFAPSRTPLADRGDLDDAAARRSIVALSTRSAPDGEGREPIAYRDLGVEQLGAIYETLLDYRPTIEPASRHRRGRPQVDLIAGAGIRKATATFYTPQTIASVLIRQTLGPLVHEAPPERILALRILDPSMGSGAFIVGACAYLADAYENALINSGACLASDLGPHERATIKRTVAERCLFGVDLNPTAVQLARLSLWLATLAHDRPLSFLDHHLVTGDSVLGAWLTSLRHAPVRRPSTSALPLFGDQEVAAAFRDVLPIRFALSAPSDTAEAVRKKERALAAINNRATLLSAWKRVADLWCARWFVKALFPPAVFASLSDAVLTGASALPQSTCQALLDLSEDTARTRRFFHWELEFPEVFFGDDGQRLPDGGFDAVIGNPPWDMVRADGGASEDSTRQRDPGSVVRFTRDTGVYTAQSDGHANCYQLFLERAIALTRPAGRVGLVLPSGVLSDYGSARLRRLLFSTCAVDTVTGFDNRRAIFPIHRSVRFTLLTATRGRPTTSIACRFGLTDPSVLEAVTRRSQAPDDVVRLSPALIETLSGSELSIPDLRSSRDLAIAEQAASRFPPLGSAAGWNAHFGRELNATEDREAFRTDRRGVPVVEGKQIEPFRVNLDAARFWMTATEANRRLPARWLRPRLAYRDVASATNRLTLIAAILPAQSVSTHTVLCLKTPLDLRAQHFLCGILNSLIVNYLVRLRVTTHVTTAIVERLPTPRADHVGEAFLEIAACARLSRKREDRAAGARLNALVARAYGLSVDDFAHVLGTFPLVPASERDAAMRLFRSISSS